MLRILMLAHVIACIFYMAGLYWRFSIHTGEECRMTYSYPNFVSLSVQPSKIQSTKLSRHYKLYKFVDGRDPRYQHLIHSLPPLHSTQQHCGANATVVLYIPGHWGSYSQARSLGAHGTQWTKAQQDSRRGVRALRMGEWSGKTSRLDQFVYEVYAVDFAEQGGAWHGRFLEAQSDFVAQVTEQLVVRVTG
jgi:PGAP1-like protein